MDDDSSPPPPPIIDSSKNGANNGGFKARPIMSDADANANGRPPSSFAPAGDGGGGETPRALIDQQKWTDMRRFKFCFYFLIKYLKRRFNICFYF
jgi:hypothetical protein